MKTFTRKEIQQHKLGLDVNEPKDYIDSYLIEGIKSGDPLFTDEGKV